FITASPAFDERAEDHRFGELGAEAFALHLAQGKASSLQVAYADAYIVGADQVAVVDGPPIELLHKPGCEVQAVAQLMRLSGRSFSLVTGVVLLDARTGEARTAVDVQRLTMRAYGEP